MTKTSEQLRTEAAGHFQEAYDSFQRCDTDGYLSQWASDLTGQLKQTLAYLHDNQGVAEFFGLYWKHSKVRVRAKLVNGKFGLVWALCNKDDKFTGKFIPYGKNSQKQKTLGLCERQEYASANARFAGTSKFDVHVQVYRTDKGYPEDAVEYNLSNVLLK